MATSSQQDFQAELLRINGLLQTSITELRYRCEVYRLSLRSICKVLLKVKTENETRQRFLSTSAPRFQAHLLSLSQKQALDRIWNVVRKASSFINGYSLVDKGLFQPPPPKPGCTGRGRNDTSKKISPPPAVALKDDSHLLSKRLETPTVDSTASFTETRAYKDSPGGSKYETRLLSETDNNAKAHSSSKKHKVVANSQKKSHRKKSNKSSNGKNKEESEQRKRCRNNEKVKDSYSHNEKKSSKSKTIRLKETRNSTNLNKESKSNLKSIPNKDPRLIKSQSNSYRTSDCNSNNRKGNSVVRSVGGNDQRKKHPIPSLLTMSQIHLNPRNYQRKQQPPRKTFSSQDTNREKLRDSEERRDMNAKRPSREQQNGRKNVAGPVSSVVAREGSSKEDDQRRRGSATRTRLKERRNERQKKWNHNPYPHTRNKFRESLAFIRNRQNNSSAFVSTRQGQGVAQKYSYSGASSSLHACRNNNRNNSLKLRSIPKLEKVKRVRLEQDEHEQENDRFCCTTRKNCQINRKYTE